MNLVMITGASRGIGAEITLELLRQGYQVVGVSRGGPLEEVKEAYASSYRHIQCDLSDVAAVTEYIIQPEFIKGASYYGLINNAAVAYDDIVTNIDYSALTSMFAINTMIPMLLTKYAIRNMLNYDKAGSLIHVSSICAHTGYKGLAMYAATKGAMESFSRTTAREWGSRGIRSNCIVPGFTETDMNQNMEEAMRSRIYARTALREPTRKESIAATVHFLLSDRSRSITGQNIFVDSGTI
ncbi:MAG TPA: SDR family oxidoreductase [Bacteroidota bacterium]|nr:SDR family oxidoreductase [Bacteroidota bacterium]